MTHPADLSIFEAGAMLRAGTLTSTDLTAAHLDRIATRNPAIGAFVHVAAKAALTAARAADLALSQGQDLGPLHGIPFAIKDIFDVQDWPTRYGSQLYAARIATKTAPAVQRMLDGGAVPLGLVATYELATVGPDLQSLYPQPRNPWNRDHITGGSSSGSAAAVAAGMVRIALASDTGGSIRSPSAYCGVVGLKPTYGAVPTKAVMPLAPSLDHIGPIAASVAEAAAVFDILAARTTPRRADITGLRLAFGRDWCQDPAAHRDLCATMDAAASTLTLCGARIALLALGDYPAIESAAAKIILAEEFASHGAALRANPTLVGPMASASILSGAAITPAALTQAKTDMQTFSDALDDSLGHHDALILPTTMAPAPPFSAFANGVAVWTAMRTLPFNVTGHPAISLPMGFADGLPLGLQIIARRGDEATLLRIAAAFEAATDHAAAPPTVADQLA